jgi:hypothetical protein
MWYIRRNNTVYGPYGTDSVRKFFSMKQWHPSDEVATTSNGAWMPLHEWPRLELTLGGVLGQATRGGSELSGASSELLPVDGPYQIDKHDTDNYAWLASDTTGRQAISAVNEWGSDSGTGGQQADMPPKEVSSSAKWYVRVKGMIRGPYTAEEIATKLKDGKILLDSLAKQGDGLDWRRLQDCLELNREILWHTNSRQASRPRVSGNAIERGSHPTIIQVRTLKVAEPTTNEPQSQKLLC